MPLDPIIAGMLANLPDTTPLEAMRDTANAERSRAALEAVLPYSSPDIDVDDELIPGPAGRLRIRVYQPPRIRVKELRPALVWVHGGGFIGGSIDDREADMVSREICARASAVVISVDYHLANGKTVTYPQLHLEVIAAFHWARANSEHLGIDTRQLALGGASAGGSLAISATLEMRDRQEPLPARLLLAYPAIDEVIPYDKEVQALCSELPNAVRFSPETMAAFWDAYRGNSADLAFISPSHHDLTVFPDCTVIVNEYDEIRPSGEALAQQLRADAVYVNLYLAQGVTHGHLGLSPMIREVDATLQFMADMVSGGTFTRGAP